MTPLRQIRLMNLRGRCVVQHESSTDADLGMCNVGSCPQWRFTGGDTDLIAYNKSKFSDIVSVGCCLKPACFWPFADHSSSSVHMCSVISDNVTLQGGLLGLQVRLLADPSQISNLSHFQPNTSTAGPISGSYSQGLVATKNRKRPSTSHHSSRMALKACLYFWLHWERVKKKIWVTYCIFKKMPQTVTPWLKLEHSFNPH